MKKVDIDKLRQERDVVRRRLRDRDDESQRLRTRENALSTAIELFEDDSRQDDDRDEED